MARDRGGPQIALQILSIAVTDLTGSQSSVEAFGDGYLLSAAGMRTQREHYLGDAVDPRHPYVSPLFAPDLTGLPPALVVTMEFDPHRHEAEAYARRLVEAGVLTVQRRFLGPSPRLGDVHRAVARRGLLRAPRRHDARRLHRS